MLPVVLTIAHLTAGTTNNVIPETAFMEGTMRTLCDDVRDQVRDQVADLLDLEVISAEFHEGRHVRQDIIEPTDIEQLLAVARENRDRRADVLNRVGGAHVTPVLGPPGPGARPRSPRHEELMKFCHRLSRLVKDCPSRRPFV